MRTYLGSALLLLFAACSHERKANDATAMTEPTRVTASNEAATTSPSATNASATQTNSATPSMSNEAPNETARRLDAARNDTQAPSTYGAPSGTSPSGSSATGETRSAEDAPSTSASSRSDHADQMAHGSQPDNTRVNKRDRDSAALTPPSQSESEGDRQITQSIRKAVMGDKSLSFTAKNVKIITQGGKVTLRGPVNSDAERSAIERSAKNVAGVVSVDNQLEVKGSK